MTEPAAAEPTLRTHSPDPRLMAAIRPQPASEPPAGSAPDSHAPDGHAQVDAVIAELDRVADLPPADQIEVYESVHRTLQESLQGIEQG